VASKFHKGRLLVSWDPNYFKSEEENIQYSKIVDISEDRDITFEVGWGQPEAYLRLNHDLPETVPFQSRSAAYTGRQDRCNGIVSIRVLNPLAVATDAVGNNNVDINVFVSAGDNFEVADPYIGSLRYSPFEEQSYEGPYEEQSDLLDASPPEADSQDTMGQEVIDKSALIYHSDPVISLRQILKRYTYAYRFPLVYQYTNPLYPGTQIAGCLRSAYNPYPGYNPNVGTETIGLVRYNFNPHTLISWYGMAYTGYRGSIRHKVFATCTDNEGKPLASRVIVRRENFSNSSQTFGTSYSRDGVESVSEQSSGYMVGKSIGAGAAMSDLALNPSVTIEVPYIQPSRFSCCRDNDLWTENASTLASHPRFAASLSCPNVGTDANPSYMSLASLSSIGEDFSFSFHVGPPALYKMETTPVPRD
jgi:hypothetical protein